MAKREFIETREIVYVNAPIAPILQGDSIHYEDIAFKSQIGRIHSFSEHDIVKPYLEKLKAEIGKSKTEHEMQIAERDIKAKLLISNIYCDIVNILDKCKTESEG